MTTATADFSKRLDQTADDTEALLAKLLSDTLLPDEITRPKRLMDAMRYSSLNGGKRLRPFLVVESAAVFGVPREAALLVGAALECIHCYSLIHDDLPAMDNSDLRRGRPTLHKKTDDATAILAGDGLLTLAFDIVTRDEIHEDATVRLLLTRALARASGIGGMVGGQILDLAGEGRFGDREPVDVARLQQMKTGALLRFGCIAGALLGQAPRNEYQALDDYGRALGEAFQIADDLLDVEGDATALGKPAGADAALGKTTFAALALGIVASLLLPASLRSITRALIGWDVFIGFYVVLVFTMMLRSGHHHVRRNAARQDDGRFVILVFTALGAFASIAAILFELGVSHRGAPELSLATVTIALSWVAVHTSFALHYA